MKNVDKTGQYCPLKRAERISKMSNPTEVLWQFEDMSEGGDGGSSGSYLPGEPSIRQKYYAGVSNDWFKKVLIEYNRITCK